MRVGFFTEVYHPVVNGVVASIDALASGLRSFGHEVYCFAPRVPGYRERGEPVYRIPSLPLPTPAPYRLTVPLISRRGRRAIVNRLEILHAHSPFVTGWMAARYSRRLHIPLVYTYHTQLEQYAHYVPFDEETTRRAASTLTRSFANLAHAVIVPTKSMSDHLAALGVTARIEVIPSGIDLQHFASGTCDAALRARLGVRDGERLLLFVSRLAREKNIDVLLEATAACAPQFRLVLAGDGPERATLQARVEALGIAGRVVFLGEVERAALPALYASCDAFVFPSITETQGLVVAEALSAGAYVIAADTPQMREVVSGAGRLVESTAAAFAAALRQMPRLPDRAEAARARAAAGKFGIDAQASAVSSLYADLTRTYVRYTIEA
jgi:1,2-diacylglycerol 3-alpha-glucosyltransferase